MLINRLVIYCSLGHVNKIEQPLLGQGAGEGKPQKSLVGEEDWGW